MNAMATAAVVVTVTLAAALAAPAAGPRGLAGASPDVPSAGAAAAEEEPGDDVDGGWPVVGEPSATLEDALAWAARRGASAVFLEEVVPEVWTAWAAVGHDPAVGVVQAAHETGFGHWGGVLDASFHNPGALKTAEGGPDDDPDAHERFASWEQGSQAHANHATAYTGQEPVGFEGSRRDVVLQQEWAGTVETVEELGDRWATASYGEQLREYLEELSGEPLRHVERRAGADRYETAAEVAAAGWDRADEVLLARGDGFADALAAGALAAERDAPVLLTDPEALPAATATALVRLDPEQVTVLGGSAAVGDGIVKILEDAGLTVERLAGADRYETARLVAAAAGPADTGEVVVASGADFPDAVAAGALTASSDRLPLVLTPPEGPDEHTLAALEELEADTAILVGGPAAVGEAVAEELDALEYDTVRLSGHDRVGTARAVSREAQLRDDHRDGVVVATAADYPDALTGAAFAARTEQLLALVVLDRYEAIPDGALSAVVLGGTGAVPAEVAMQIDAMLEDAHDNGHDED